MVVQQWTIIDPFHGPLLPGEINHLIRLIDAALLAAKRSAHLEDARAGCKWCKPIPDLKKGYAVDSEAHRSSDGFWRHRLTWPSGRESVPLCERPEVWDALSLPPKP